MSYFDKTLSSELTNKFSNDLNILDNTITDTVFDVMERFIGAFVLCTSIIRINNIMTFSVALWVILIVCLFLFLHFIVMKLRQLNLEMKIPIFQILKETISGIIHIRIFHQRENQLKNFAEALNNELRANISFLLISRLQAVFTTYTTLMMLNFGLLVGLATMPTESMKLFGVMIIYLIQINSSFQFGLKQLVISNNSIMSS